MQTNQWTKWMSWLCFVVLMLLPSAAFAAEQIVEADGEYLVGTGLEESFSKARERAEANAMANAAKQMAVYVEAMTEVKNHRLTASEVCTLAAKVMGQVKPSTFNNVGEGDVIRIRCHVVVRVKDDDVLAALLADRQQLKDSLQREQEKDEKIAELNRQMEELNQKYLAAKTDGEREAIRQQAKENDTFFTAMQWLGKAVQAYDAKDYTKATAFCLTAIELEPNLAIAYGIIGLVYNAGGEYNKAIESLNKELDLKPGYSPAYNNLGYAYVSKGEYNKAIECFNKAIALDPNDPLAYYNLGIAYRKKGEYDKAIESYIKAIALNPNFAMAYNNLGIVYRRKGEYDKAIESYIKAIALDPNDAEAYNNLGNVHSDKGEYTKAIHYYDEAIAIDQKYSVAYYNRGLCYEKLGRLNDAKRDYAKAYELDPNDETNRKNKKLSENW